MPLIQFFMLSPNFFLLLFKKKVEMDTKKIVQKIDIFQQMVYNLQNKSKKMINFFSFPLLSGGVPRLRSTLTDRTRTSVGFPPERDGGS